MFIVHATDVLQVRLQARILSHGSKRSPASIRTVIHGDDRGTAISSQQKQLWHGSSLWQSLDSGGEHPLPAALRSQTDLFKLRSCVDASAMATASPNLRSSAGSARHMPAFDDGARYRALQEDRALKTLVAKHGPRWKTVAHAMRTKTDSQVEERHITRPFQRHATCSGTCLSSWLPPTC